MTARILVVDNDEDWLDVYVGMLAELDSVELVLEQRSARAAAMLRDEQFDLLLSDLDMPEVSGMDLLSLATEVAPHMPVVIVTGHGPHAEASCVAGGASAVVHKPVRPDHLLRVIRRALSRELRARPIPKHAGTRPPSAASW